MFCIVPANCSPLKLLRRKKRSCRPPSEVSISYVKCGSNHTSILDIVQSKTFRLISSPPVTNFLLPLKLTRNVIFLSIFYLMLTLVPPNLIAACFLFLAASLNKTFYSSTYLYCPKTYVVVHLHFYAFTFFIGKLWNCLSLYVFNSAYDLTARKS